uniref:cysteine desulfurase n=1 Tax=Chromera velia CCMP2878 TaxID=1169474 RepID=A0A0G4HHU5_9ALVE|mmetsp:Transcript_17696/g.35937  ORF Transcript_17696/g.35937 Transcript_17696/m.35937 type:complete len:475 (+) Transcript_17696:145-1569(+)|eukprot:Cvel_27718.t1-p1 / transcript=Cvel_27718.t1 / gene=Cvel_27718 / organism=Chromera_velia_CCMP2878 / gene_product=Cysteine desulfurase, mitochondrial, putative / transcript_product=Cysteine desulfurase, mitochondrial, putative / location=Cvel_scaffold3504:1871-6174(-) / protein_length=474 / sequence_SO=supercontig / SO=protein_coding / is_pseudo=false
MLGARALPELSRRLRAFNRVPSFCGGLFNATRTLMSDPAVREKLEAQTELPPRYRIPIEGEAKQPASSDRPAFFDYQSTTPVDPRVLDAMMPMYVDLYGNPHSRSHAFGWEAEEMVEHARKQVADLIGAQAKEIIFTSGATESNNIAIKGVAQYFKNQGAKKNHIITTQVEHKCVLSSCRSLQDQGWDVTYLPVDTKGLLNLEELEASIRDDTALVSVMHVNNEIGTMQPLKEIAAICKKKKVLLHTDAAQAVGKVPFKVDDFPVDLVSISSHKLYGPKGVGALYIRSKPKRVRLVPQMDGGGQERGFRSGTLPAAICVGFGAACEIAGKEMENDARHIERLTQRLMSGIRAELDEVILNGPETTTQRYSGNVNLSFAYVEGESLLMSLKGVAVSSGSACTSASLEPSYVLRAIGVDEELAHTSLRFGLGRFTTEEEVDACVRMVVAEVKRLRDMSPLYEMAKEEGGGGKMVWT